MPFFISALIYLMFFFSGAAALIYQVVWVRSLSLIFGGSHLAVTAVLTTFMAGLALGGYWIGRHADRVKKPLRLYGLLEIGVALFALLFVGLMKIYPSIYILFAQGKDSSPLYLSLVRIIFSVLALIIPTTLMGGTLPVLSRFVSGHPGRLKQSLAFLYGLNTLGAVLGASLSGFFFLRLYSVSITLGIAVAANTLIGLSCLWLQNSYPENIPPAPEVPTEKESPPTVPAEAASGTGKTEQLPYKLVLWGIGVSGFCALGYEVLWTRVLSIVIGTSVYGFTTMLVAFLTGIALGSKAYGLMPSFAGARQQEGRGSAIGFGMVQILIGIAAIAVTIHLRHLPSHAHKLLAYFESRGIFVENIRIWKNIFLAFSYMLIPAFLMGVAFPLAGKVHADYTRRIGRAVGQVLAFNTVGAILGAALSGFLMIHLFGIERSLQMLVTINIGFGVLVFASLLHRRALNWGVVGVTVSMILFLAYNPEALKLWDMKYFAIYRNNHPDLYSTPEKTKEAVENTDVLYYAEGLEATISVIRPKGGSQAVLVNGKVVATSLLEGQQCQYTLGHLPMLLHKNPENVLVVGLGTGMTLGATSVHPGVKKLILAEIAPSVIPAARTFQQYNHRVVDNPKLQVYFNDGRNFLLTTRERFDVITADPIHPWAQGASYLYTDEYFRMAAERLRPGGIMCQWLPLYELAIEDLRSVVRTFTGNFRYTLLWMTHYDTELIGSNSPIVINEAELEKRLAEPAIQQDLHHVQMGSAADFLSYFVMGTGGLKAFGQNGILNTDDNLYLEFSSPLAIGKGAETGKNIEALYKYRESILPYLQPEKNPEERARQENTWAANQKAASLYDPAHSMFLSGLAKTPEFESLLARLEKNYPWYAPGKFLKNEYLEELATLPRLLQQTAFTLLNERGDPMVIRISAVLARISSERAAVMFVDNDARIMYDQLYVTGLDKDEWIRHFVMDVMAGIQEAYHQEARLAETKGEMFPYAQPTMQKIKERIMSKVQQNRQPETTP